MYIEGWIDLPEYRKIGQYQEDAFDMAVEMNFETEKRMYSDGLKRALYPEDYYLMKLKKAKKLLKMEKENQLETKCCQYARSKGIAAVKIEGNKHKGIPDRIFIKSGGKTLYIEFKRGKKSVTSKFQSLWADYLQNSYALIYDFDQFVEFFNQYFNLQK